MRFFPTKCTNPTIQPLKIFHWLQPLITPNLQFLLIDLISDFMFPCRASLIPQFKFIAALHSLIIIKQTHIEHFQGYLVSTPMTLHYLYICAYILSLLIAYTVSLDVFCLFVCALIILPPCIMCCGFPQLHCHNTFIVPAHTIFTLSFLRQNHSVRHSIHNITSSFIMPYIHLACYHLDELLYSYLLHVYSQ